MREETPEADHSSDGVMHKDRLAHEKMSVLCLDAFLPRVVSLRGEQRL